jgi:Ser/Thr protein kinase RdoA (MazF antagonist)
VRGSLSVVGLPGQFMLDDCATIVTLFPNDCKVTTLAFIGQPERNAAVLQDLLPTSENPGALAVDPLSYRPERRFVGKLVGPDGFQGVLKLYNAQGYEDAYSTLRSFSSRGRLRVPRLLACSARYRAAVFQWLNGRLLSEAILDPALDASTVVTVGETLAELHAQELPGVPSVTSEKTAAGLRSDATTIGHLCPGLDARAHELAEKLAVRLPDKAPVYRRLHGDFHPRQVLLDGNVIGVIDLDAACNGDPAIDLGSFLGRLEREVLRGRLHRRQADTLFQAVLDGYESSSRTHVRDRVPFTLAVTLLRLAHRSFRHREPDWPTRMAETLERAEAAIAAARRTGRGSSHAAKEAANDEVSRNLEPDAGLPAPATRSNEPPGRGGSDFRNRGDGNIEAA